MGRRRVSGKFADHSKYFLENLEIFSKAPTRSRKIIVAKVVRYTWEYYDAENHKGVICRIQRS